MRSKPLIAYGWLRALLFLCCMLVVYFGAAYLAAFVIAGNTNEIAAILLNPSFKELALYYTVSAVCTVLLVVIFRLSVDRQTIYSLGFMWKGFQKYAWTGFFAALFILSAGSLLLVITGYLKFTDTHRSGENLLFTFVLFIIVSFNEEIIIRGYVLSNLMQSMNKWMALAISAAVFALFHLGNPGTGWVPLLNIFAAGFFLGINYIFTQNLWFSIFFHFAWNFFQGSILGYDVSGFKTEGLFVQTLNGPEIITGGIFGFEGSVFALIFCTLAIIIFASYYSKSENL